MPTGMVQPAPVSLLYPFHGMGRSVIPPGWAEARVRGTSGWVIRAP